MWHIDAKVLNYIKNKFGDIIFIEVVTFDVK